MVMYFPEHGSAEYIVSFTRYRGDYFRGELYVDRGKLERGRPDWIQENVSIYIREFPVRIACTGSMRPVIDCGDEVIFEAAPFDDPLQVGDMITFRFSSADLEGAKVCQSLFNPAYLWGTQYILHRIEQKVGWSYPPKYITKGDNNLTRDPCSVSESSIIFRVVAINKDVYVIDQARYEQYVKEHQEIMSEYQEKFAEYQDLRERYSDGLSEYYDKWRSRASQAELNDHYRYLEDLRRQVNRLGDELNRIGRDMRVAQRRIEQTVR